MVVHRRAYSAAQIYAHWAGAALVTALFASAWVREGVEDTALRRLLLDWHRLVGLVLMALSLVRLGLRLARPAPPPLPGMPVWQHRVAGLVHGGLYLLLFLQPASGWLLASARGRALDLFGWLPLPALMAKDAERAEWLGLAHASLSWALLALVALHAGAALAHAVVLKDGTLDRMRPPGRGFSRPSTVPES
ncbi:cytochrome b/b6 domain-containing protein [Nitrospirillum sp. BR 11752]|uniref:cytochrome b n=1 Tax=Nitrospirillum sp. BR 11752 TaxID=3104293 RepID=UPI002EB32BE9|nr:cytochrome b/b6 domain-containing protein [Nitrospirillum sp. BR 11752]